MHKTHDRDTSPVRPRTTPIPMIDIIVVGEDPAPAVVATAALVLAERGQAELVVAPDADSTRLV